MRSAEIAMILDRYCAFGGSQSDQAIDLIDRYLSVNQMPEKGHIPASWLPYLLRQAGILDSWQTNELIMSDFTSGLDRPPTDEEMLKAYGSWA